MKINFMTVFGLVSLITSEVQDSYKDKKITAGELVEIVAKIVEALNLENKVLIDNSKD